MGLHSLNRITKPAVERWGGGPGAREPGIGRGTLAPGTIEKIYQTFRKVKAAAVDDDRIPKLPCPARPPLARGKRKPVRYLAESEVSTLAGASGPRYEAAIYLLACGGFRLGELTSNSSRVLVTGRRPGASTPGLWRPCNAV